jgi:hypothetical protein
MLSSYELYLYVWRILECLKEFLAELEESMGLLLFMLSDHLIHLKSGLKENAANSRTCINVSDIVLLECERLVNNGSAIVVSFGQRNSRIVKRNDSKLCLNVLMIMECLKFMQKIDLLCSEKAENFIDFKDGLWTIDFGILLYFDLLYIDVLEQEGGIGVVPLKLILG